MLRIEIIGNLTADAEVKSVGERKAINFSVAVNQNFKNSSGEKIEKTSFFACTVWRDSNVNVAKYLTKGTKILIEGTPEVDMYKDKEGNVKGSIKITVKNLELLGGGSGKKEGYTDKSDDINF